MAEPQQYSLKWNNYLRQLTFALDNHRVNDEFVDVSLLCDGRKIKAHKVVLSSCSSYFKEIFTENPHPHPIIIFKFIKFEDLQSIIKFMYQGEVNVEQEGLQSFMQTAKMLAVHGLGSDNNEDLLTSSSCEQTSTSKLPEQIADLNKSNTGPKSTSLTNLSAIKRAKTTQSVVPSSSKDSTAKKRKLTCSDTSDNDFSLCATESLGDKTTNESDTRNDETREFSKLDVPEYILGAAEDQNAQINTNQESNKILENIHPDYNITEIKTESDILNVSEFDDKYQTFDETEMTIESRRFYNPSSYSFQAPLEDTASCSNTGVAGHQGNSTGNNSENNLIISEIRALKEEIIRRDEQNKKINMERDENYKHIVKNLTNELYQLKKNILLCQTDEENVSKNLPFSCADKLKQFDDELKTNSDVAAELKRIILRVGGCDFPTFLRTVIKRIITDELAMQFSWKGTKEKTSIQTFFFISIIRDMVHQKFENADDTKINSILQQHLVHAKDRARRRFN